MKKKLSLFSAVMVLILCFSLFPKAPTVSAHETFYNSETGRIVDKKWYPKSSDSRAYIKVNSQLAKDNKVIAYAASSAKLWEVHCPNEVKVDMNVPFDQSNVDFASCSSKYWHDTLGFVADDTYAYTIYKFLGQSYTTKPTVDGLMNSPYYIEKTMIYFNPEKVASYSTLQIQKTCTHEVGHALALGHPDRPGHSPIGSSVKSIMRQGPYAGYVTPQQHDKDDIAKKY